MVLNPVPGGEDPTLQLPLGVPPAEPQKVAPRGLDSGGDDTLEEASPPSTAEQVDVEPPQLAKDIGAGEDAFGSEPTVPRIEVLSAEGSRPQADKPLDALSAMPKAPVLDLGIEFAIRVAPGDVTADEPSDGPSEVASQGPSDVASAEPGEAASAEPSEVDPQGRTVLPEEVSQYVASSEPKPSAAVQALAAEPRPPSAIAQAPVREPPRTAPGIEPLANALDAAVRLAADASVAAEALEKLKVLLQHKQQLEGLRSVQAVEHKQPFHALRSTQPALARSTLGAEASASEAHAIALPVPPPLPPLPLPVPAEASMGRTRLPLQQPRRRALLERRGLDVRGFMAGFALSWAFGVVLYFFMTAG
jgi:hypothetical protein